MVDSTSKLEVHVSNEDLNNERHPILSSKDKLKKIKEELDQLIDSMAQNRSMLSRIAILWGEIPLWQKIGAGIAILVPALLVGIFLHIGSLIAISIFALVVYTGGGVLFQNHYNHSTSSTENLKKGVTGLADTLGGVIDLLETIHQQFSLEIDHLKQEITRLSASISLLDQQSDELHLQGDLLQKTVLQSSTIQDKLKTTIDWLERSIAKHTDLLAKTQAALSQARDDLTTSQLNLAEKTAELALEKEQLSKTLSRYKIIVQAMGDTADTLAKTFGANERGHNKAQESLCEALSKDDSNLSLVLDQIKAIHSELVALKDEQIRLNSQLETEVVRTKTLNDQVEPLLKKRGFFSATQSTGTNSTTGLSNVNVHYRNNNF